MKKKIVITLREQIKIDNLVSYKWRNDPKVWKNTLGINKYLKFKKITYQDELQWFKKTKKDKGRKNLSILADGKKLIGYIYFTNIKKSYAQFHIVIGNKNFWNKGLGYRATILSLNFARYNYDLKNIYLFVKKNNIPALKIYKKIGFRLININKNHLIKMNFKIK